MIRVKTEVLEVRGLSEKRSAKGNDYLMLYCEREDGEAVEFYCKEPPKGDAVKKGDKVVLHCMINKYKDIVVLEMVKTNGNA